MLLEVLSVGQWAPSGAVSLPGSAPDTRMAAENRSWLFSGALS